MKRQKLEVNPRDTGSFLTHEKRKKIQKKLILIDFNFFRLFKRRKFNLKNGTRLFYNGTATRSTTTTIQ